MAVSLKHREKIILEKGCDFLIGSRAGRVLELRPEGYLIFWEAWADPDTGEVISSDAGVMSYKAIVTEDKNGTLKILKRPGAQIIDRDRVRRSQRTLDEIARMRFKKQFVLAVYDLLDSGEMKLTRDDFCRMSVSIVAQGTRRYTEYLASMSMREVKRGGAKVVKSKVEQKRSIEFHQGFKNGQTFWKWYQQWLVSGDEGLFDKYRNCGKYGRYSDLTELFCQEIMDSLWDQERPTIKSMVESVQAAIDAENERRERLPIPAEKLPMVGYDYVLGLIKKYAPIDSAIRQKGWDQAYKDMHSIGVGVEVCRLLQRVEVDEYTADLFVLFERTGLFDHLPEAVKNLLQLDGSARRFTLSAAIDVHTRCLLALQIVPAGIESPLRHTLEMIYTDKSPIASAAGAKFGWPMAGAPESIVLDRGAGYITDDAYDILADLGITNLGAPAGKPWLKPFIERVFRTIHSDLLLRFSGRAFSNVVERGENDGAARATLTLEAFLGWLVRWTVDAYHTRSHTALGMSPAQAWEKAAKECAPRFLSSGEMREIFGSRTTRKLGRQGVLVEHVQYQNSKSMKMLATLGEVDVEVLRWHGDIGTISIRANGGRWESVTAANSMWIGKTGSELQAWLSERQGQTEDERIARRNFVNNVNSESIRLKKLEGLISLPKSLPDHEHDSKRFSRFADTAERRHEFGSFGDVLSELDAAPDVDHSFTGGAEGTPAPSSDGSATISDDESME